jgi:hypothetical protein
MSLAKTTSQEEISFGAVLLTHLKVHCENCKTYTTPQWRKGWYNPELQCNIELCNACGLKYAKGQYCPYCKFIYGKEHLKSPNQWLSCNMCGRLTHLQCELASGNYNNPVDLMLKSPYYCLDCQARTTRKDRYMKHQDSLEEGSNIIEAPRRIGAIYDITLYSPNSVNM